MLPRTPRIWIYFCRHGYAEHGEAGVETDKLLDWAFRTFSTVNVDWHKAVPSQLPIYKGDVDTVAIAPAGGESYFTVDKGKEGKVTLTADIPQKSLVAPLSKGTQVGQLTVMIDGKAGSSVPIVTQAAVGPAVSFTEWRMPSGSNSRGSPKKFESSRRIRSARAPLFFRRRSY